MADEKTEAPTQKKLDDARKKGSNAKSPDLVSAALLLAALVVLQLGGNDVLDVLRQILDIALGFMSTDRSTQAMMSALFHILGVCAVISTVIAVTGMLAAVSGTMTQVGVRFSMEPVMPKLSSVNPASGIKRLFSWKSLLDIAKMTIKAIILGIVLWKTITDLFPIVTHALYQPLPQLSAMLWSAFLKLIGVAFLIYLVIGATDWKLQHLIFMHSQKMTKDEVKRERKNTDGDPKIKGERKKLAKELMRGDPRPAAVARANVLVVNPTHYAVAIRYAPEEYPLPVVLAKGIDAEAAFLRRLATRHDIPIVANPPVARALHAVDTNTAIPEPMFEVVAAILRWVDSVAPHCTARHAAGETIPTAPISNISL